MFRSALRRDLYVDPLGHVARVVALQRAGTCITLLGPPGVGKSRLLHEVVRDARPHDAVSVSLQDTSTVEAFLAEIGDAIGCPLPPSATLDEWRAKIGAQLARRKGALLALDALEQVPASADATLAEWAQRGGATFFLASRRALVGVPGEVVVVECLPTARVGTEWAPAAQLLRARAFENARVDLGEADAAHVHALSRAVDGVPLALELLAAKLEILTPAEALGRLGERGSVDALEGSIRTSYDLLGSAARACLCAAATFRGGFSLEAIEAVLGPEVPALDAMQTLRHQSLLVVERHDDVHRFGLLSSVRAFAERHGRLELATWQLRCERHARATEARIARLSAGGAAPAVLREERENVRTAFERQLDAGGASASLALLLTMPSLGLSYAQIVDVATRALGAGEHAELRLRRGTARRFLGDLAGASADLEAALTEAERLGDARVVAEALAGLGNVASVTSDWKTGRTYIERALCIHPAAEFRAVGLTMVANTFCNEDDHATAEPMMREAARHAPAESMPGAVARLALGVLLVEKGELEEAFALLSDASAALSAHPHWQGIALTYLGRIRHESGHLAGALQLYEEARALIEDAGVRRAQAVLDLQCGLVLLELGELGAADTSLRSALVLTRATCPDHEGFVLAAQAVLAVLRGAGADRERLFERAERVIGAYCRPIFAAAIATLRGTPSDALPADLRETSDVAWARRMHAKMAAAPVGATLLVGAGAAWFRVDGHETTALGRRRAIQQILAELVRERLEHPGALVSIDDLVRTGWPGATLVGGSGQERLYAAVATLRRLGLRGILEQEGQGYRLSVATEVIAQAAAV